MKKQIQNAAELRPGRFLLTPAAIRSKFLITFLTWLNLLLVIFAVLSEMQGDLVTRWLLLVVFLNTVAVGLTYREMLRMVVQQEVEILNASKAKYTGPVAESEVRESKIAEPALRLSRRQSRGS